MSPPRKATHQGGYDRNAGSHGGDQWAEPASNTDRFTRVPDVDFDPVYDRSSSDAPQPSDRHGKVGSGDQWQERSKQWAPKEDQITTEDADERHSGTRDIWAITGENSFHDVSSRQNGRPGPVKYGVDMSQRKGNKNRTSLDR